MLLIFLSLLSVTAAYPTGAPESTCTLWTAGHEEHQVQGGPPPYQIIFDGTAVTLEVTKDVHFKGFFIQGQDAATKQPIGKFQASTGGQTRDCSGAGSADSITHVGKNNKTSVTFKWQAPASFQGKVQFRAIVVQEYETFWNNVYSDKYTLP